MGAKKSQRTEPSNLGSTDRERSGERGNASQRTEPFDLGSTFRAGPLKGGTGVSAY